MESCPGGLVSIAGSCVKCHTNCLECEGYSTRCTKCKEGTYLKDHECVSKSTCIAN